MKYNYEAMDASGRESRGEIEADSLGEAQDKLRANHLFCTKLTNLPEGQNKPWPIKIIAAIIAFVLMFGLIFIPLSCQHKDPKPTTRPIQQQEKTAPAMLQFQEHFFIHYKGPIPKEEFKDLEQHTDTPQIITVRYLGRTFIHDPNCPRCKP